MADKKTYSSSEICDLFGISKTTLFRWEEDEKIPSVPRDLSDYRTYTKEHIQAISKLQKEQNLVPQYDKAIQKQRKQQLEMLSAQISLRKFLQDDITGLYELAEYPDLPNGIIHRLLQMALDICDPDDEDFCEIIEVISRHSCTRRDKRSKQEEPLNSARVA